MENNPLSILAIDDKEDNLTSVKALIRESFPQAIILTATEADKGIELAQAENPDVILLDVVMPGMDGFEACQQLKANPLTRSIPVVFLTAIKGDQESRIRALEVGAEAFLSKPIDEIELTAQIRAMQKIKAASEREQAEKQNLSELVAARTCELELAHADALNLLEDLRKENTARQESEASLRLLFENLPSGVVVHSPDTAVRFANSEALRLLGLTLEQMQGKTATDPAWCFLREDGKSLALEDYPVNRVLTSGKPFQGQIIGMRLPDWAEPNWVQCSAYPQLDASGQLSQIIVAFTDITARVQAEEAIRRAEKRSGALIENAPDGIVFVSADGKFTYASPTTSKLFGYVADDMSQLDPNILTHPDDLPRVLTALSGVVQNPSLVTTLQYRFRHQDGRWLWIESTFSNLIAEPSIQAIVINFRDITEHKQAEEALLKASENLAYAQSAARAGMWDWDMATGDLTWSPELFSLFECDPSTGSATFELWRRVVHPEDREKAEACIHQAVLNHRPLENEYRIVTSSGRVIWIGARGNTSYGADGTPVRMSGICLDITERKLAEAALRESEQRHRDYLAYSPYGIFVADEQGRLVQVNPAACSITGYSEKELLSKSVSDLHVEESREDAVRHFQAVVREGKAIGELKFRPKSGESRWWLVSAVKISDTRFLGFCNDITSRKQAEAELRASQQLTESIIESIPGTFYMLDEAGKYVRWSAYQRDEIVGKTDDEIAGFPAIDTIHPDDRALIQARIANVLQTGVVETVEGRVLLRGGPKFQWLLMTGRQLVVAGHSYLVGIGIDITTHKEADAKLNEQLDELRRWQVVTLGRENRVQELKREVNEACRRLGEPVRYTSQENGEPNSGEERV